MPATLVSEYLFEAKPLWTGRIGTAGVSDSSVTTIPLSSASGLDNGDAYVITIDRVDSAGNRTPSKREVVIGQLSGDNLINCIRGHEGTAQEHSANAVVEVLFTAAHWNKLIAFLEVSHSQSGDLIIDGWNKLPTTNQPTYASTTTLTNPTGIDWTTYLSVGDSVNFDNGTNKSAYVVAVTSTTLTLLLPSGVTVANSAITNFKYSKVPGKIGWIDWTPTVSGFGSMTTTGTVITHAKFTLLGRYASVKLGMRTTCGGTLSNAILATLPISAVLGSYRLSFCFIPGTGFSQFWTQPSGANLVITRIDQSNFPAGESSFYASEADYQI